MADGSLIYGELTVDTSFSGLLKATNGVVSVASIGIDYLSGSSNLENLSDIIFTSPLEDGQVLTYNSSSAIWTNQTISSGITDHSLLTNLDYASSNHTGFAAETHYHDSDYFKLDQSSPQTVTGTPTLPLLVVSNSSLHSGELFAYISVDDSTSTANILVDTILSNANSVLNLISNTRGIRITRNYTGDYFTIQNLGGDLYIKGQSPLQYSQKTGSIEISGGECLVGMTVYNGDDLTLRGGNSYGSSSVGGNVILKGGTAWNGTCTEGKVQITGSVDFDGITGNIDFGSNTVTSLNFISDVSIGTQPYACTSTTVNTNLNADLWDGYQFSDYLDQAVKQASSPTFNQGNFTAVHTTTLLTDHLGEHTAAHKVIFDNDISRAGTLSIDHIGEATGSHTIVFDHNLTISTKNIVTDTSTGSQIGTGTTQKLGFFGATPVVQQLAATDLGTVLSNLGLRASGTAYPLATTAVVKFDHIAEQTGAHNIVFDNTIQTGNIELGAASDTTLARVSAGVVSIEGKNIYVAGGTDVAVADGGTGASTAATAATNLGLGTGDSPQFTAINLGHATDTTFTRVSAGVAAIEGNTIVTSNALKIPFYTSAGALDTIPLTSDSKIPFYKTDSSASNIPLTT